MIVAKIQRKRMAMSRVSKRKENGVSQAEVQPWHRLGGMEHICELRKNAQVLYAILVTVVRMIYSTKKGRTFGCPDVIWKTDPQKTKIWIDTELRWEDQRPDFTPAIFVSLGEMKYEPPPLLGMNFATVMHPDGEQEYQRNVTSSATIIHISDKAGAACALADNTEAFLSSMQDQIRKEYCFDHFCVTGRVPRQKKDEQQLAGKGKYMSAVAVQFDYEEGWTVKFETPILKAVSVIDESHEPIKVAGTDVDMANGTVELNFGDFSTETDTPLDM